MPYWGFLSCLGCKPLLTSLQEVGGMLALPYHTKGACLLIIEDSGFNCVPCLTKVLSLSDTTGQRKAQKLVRHSQFCERSSPPVKARAPTSSTTNCGQIMNKQQLFIFPNSLTIHQTPPLHNTFYFNNTWTKIQLESDPVNMQPDETKCYPQRPITTLWPAACKMLSTSSGSPLRTVGHYHYTWRGTAGFGGELQGIRMSH